MICSVPTRFKPCRSGFITDLTSMARQDSVVRATALTSKPPRAIRAAPGRRSLACAHRAPRSTFLGPQSGLQRGRLRDRYLPATGPVAGRPPDLRHWHLRAGHGHARRAHPRVRARGAGRRNRMGAAGHGHGQHGARMSAGPDARRLLCCTGARRRARLGISAPPARSLSGRHGCRLPRLRPLRQGDACWVRSTMGRRSVFVAGNCRHRCWRR